MGRELEREIVPMMLDQKVGLLVWSPLAGGFLSGKFTRDGASDNAARRAKFSFPPVNLEKGYNIIDAMKAIGWTTQRDRGASGTGVAAPSACHDQRDHRREVKPRS